MAKKNEKTQENSGVDNETQNNAQSSTGVDNETQNNAQSDTDVDNEKQNNAQKSTDVDNETQNNAQTSTGVDNETQNNAQSNAGVDNEKQNDGKKNKTEPKKGHSAKAAKLFKLYPETKELYFTSDGLAFLNQNDAVNHAGSLKEKSIETIKNL